MTDKKPGAVRPGDFRGALKRRLDSNRELRWAFEEERVKLEILSIFDALRNQKGMTQAQLAELSGTSQPMISRMFSGDDDRSPTLDTLVKIADALGMKLRMGVSDREASRSSQWVPVASPPIHAWTVEPSSWGAAATRGTWVQVPLVEAAPEFALPH